MNRLHQTRLAGPCPRIIPKAESNAIPWFEIRLPLVVGTQRPTPNVTATAMVNMVCNDKW